MLLPISKHTMPEGMFGCAAKKLQFPQLRLSNPCGEEAQETDLVKGKLEALPGLSRLWRNSQTVDNTVYYASPSFC